MQAFIRIRTALLVLAHVFVLGVSSNGLGNDATVTVGVEEPTITVSGDAEIRVVPDQVVISAGVESRAKTVAGATEKNDTMIRDILEFLKESGIEDRHVRTEYISIEPIMRRTPQYSKAQQNANEPAAQTSADPFADESDETTEQPIGYLASRQFAITVTDLKKFEAIYKGLIEQGVNRVRGIEFRSSELRKHRDQTRLNAIRAAREKAQALSTELGASLAAVKTIRESESGDYSYRRNVIQNAVDPFGDSSSDTAGFAAGQISITASVQVVFTLGDTALEK